MKETLTTTSATSATFNSSVPVDIKVSGTFVGHVSLESQTAAETTWETVPGTFVQGPTQFRLEADDSTITYRFRAQLQSGSAVVYANATANS